MKKKYILNGKIYDEDVINSFAKKSSMSLNDYLKESGAAEHNDTNTYILNGKEYDGNILAEFAQKSDMPYDEYLKEAGVKKKDGTQNIQQPSPTSSNGVSKTSEPTDGVDVKAAAQQFEKDNPDVSEYDSFNPIDLAKHADELSKKTITQQIGANSQGIPIESQTTDNDAVKKANEINDYLKGKGINSKELQRIFNDVPDEAFDVTDNNGNKNQTKQQLFQQYQNNPIATENKVNNIKTQFALEKAAYNKALQNGYNEQQASLYGKEVGNNFISLKSGSTSLSDFYNKVKAQQNLIGENLTGEERDIALQRVKENTSQFINPATPQIVDEYNSSPLKNLVDVNQFAGLETLKLFDPQIYQQAVKMLQAPPEKGKLIDAGAPATIAFGIDKIDPTINEQIGQETVKKNLADIGRQNTLLFAKDKQNDLVAASKKINNPDELIPIKEEFDKYQNIINSIVNDVNKDDERYPLSASLKFDNQVKELTQTTDMNPAENFVYHFGKGFANTAGSVRNVLTSIFGSDAANTNLEREKIGESSVERNVEYLPSTLQSSQSDVLYKFSKELRTDVNAVLKNDNLTADEKKKQVADIIGKRQSEISTITNSDAGKHANFFTKSTLYGTSSMLGDIASIAAQSAGLGEIGVGKLLSASVPMFTTTQNDFYKQALEEGKTGSVASEFANTHAMIMALAGLINPDLNIVKRSLGMNSVLGKTIAGIDEATWNNIISKNKSLLTKFQNSAKSVLGEAGKIASIYGAGTSIANDLADNTIFNKGVTGQDMLDHAAKVTKDLMINSVALFGINAISNFKSVPLEQKASIWEAGANKNLSLAQIDESIKKSEVTPSKGEQMKVVVKNISDLINKVPDENAKGKPLTDEQKAKYLYNLLIKDKANKLKSDLPEQQKEKLETAVIEADQSNNQILNGTEKKDEIPLAETQTNITDESVNPIEQQSGTNEVKEAVKPFLDEIKLPVYKNVFENGSEEDIKSALKNVSDQWHDEGTRMQAERDFGKGIVDESKKLYPQESQPSLSINKEGDSSANHTLEDLLKDGNKIKGEGGKDLTVTEVKEGQIRKILIKDDDGNVVHFVPLNSKGEISEHVKNHLSYLEETNKSIPKAEINSTTDKPSIENKNNDVVDNTENKPAIVLPKDNKPPNEVPLIKDTENKPPINEPPKVEVVPNEGDGEPKVTGVKKSITEPLRTEMSLPKVELPKMGSDIEDLQKAKTRIDNDESNPRELVQRILDDKNGYRNADEVMDMQYYAHQLSAKETELRTQLHEAETEIDKANVNGKLQQLSDEIDRQTEAAQIAGNKWGHIGNKMQVVIDTGFNPSREKQFIKDAYGGELPANVKETLDKITKERDEALSQKAKVEDLLRQRMAKEALGKIEKDAKKTTKRDETKEKLKQEEQELLKEIKKSLKKDFGNLNSGIPIPTATLETLGKLAVNYFKQGAITLEALVEKLHAVLKDDIEGISKKDIRDFIASYEPLTINRETERLNKKAEILEGKLTPPTVKTKNGKLAGVSEPTDFLKPKKEAGVFRNNTEWVKANQRVANAEYKIKQMKRKAFESQKNMYQKALMWVGRLTRLSVLSGYNVLYKLAAAATIGGAGKRIPEQAIGAIWATAFKGIAEKAPIEGAFNAKSEARFYREFFHYRFFTNAWEILKSGSSNLGKRLGSAEYEHVPLLYLPTDLHQIIKDPVKRGTFEASFRNGLVWAEKNGLDINDPLVIQSLETAAYKRAQYEIFQEQNWLSRKFTSYKSSLETKGLAGDKNAGATAKFIVDFLIPVATVPTNIVRRLATTSPFGMIRGSKMVIDAYRKGIEKLTPDEADKVMKQLKQGSLGTALWLIGWFGAASFGGLYSKFNPDKNRNEDDLLHDEMEVGGTMLPKPVQHALPLEVIQLAATMRHVYDNYRDNKGASIPESLYNAGMASIGALAEQIPVISEGAHLAGAVNNPYDAKKLKDDMLRRVEPQILRETGVITKDDLLDFKSADKKTHSNRVVAQ